MEVVARKNLRSVQALRSVAAALVVLYHVQKMMVHNAGYSFEVSNIGASGVDLFFVISGFIMIFTSADMFCTKGGTAEFLRRRFVRIVPTYWFYTSIVVLLLWFLPSLFSSTSFQWKTVLSSYFLILAEVRPGDVGTILQTGWTLCYEFYFYVVFALLLNFRKAFFVPLSVSLFALGVWAGSVVGLPPPFLVATNPILFEFVLGAVVAIIFIKGFVLPRVFAFIAIATGVWLISLGGQVALDSAWRVVYFGIPGALLLMGALSLEVHQWTPHKIFVRLGDSSYSLYLSHPLVLPAFGKVWSKLALGLFLPKELLFFVTFGTAIAVGYVMYLTVEKPLIRLTKGVLG